MVDLFRLVPEARPIVALAAEVYLKHTGPWFIGLVAHGSAVKGGFIPGSSDIDLQLFLSDDAFAQDGQLPLELGLAIHRDLARIDPAPFGYIQCYALSSRLPAGWTGPIPGAYHILAGRLPVPEATPQQLRDAAERRLMGLVPTPVYITANLVEHGASRMQRLTRLLGTEVTSTLYDLLVFRGHDPIQVWSLAKDPAVELLSPGSDTGAAIRLYFEAVRCYYPTEDSIDGMLLVIERGIAFLRAAKLSWETTR